jgi:hypothetical protein
MNPFEDISEDDKRRFLEMLGIIPPKQEEEKNIYEGPFIVQVFETPRSLFVLPQN